MPTHNNERGIALVLALFLMTALSILGASLMFLSQTETYASMNYRMMSQSRYAAESGIQASAHYLLDQTTGYPMPAAAIISPQGTTFDVTKSPVQYNGLPVVLSYDTTKSNYPDATVISNFASRATGTLQAGNVTLAYNTTATLVTMQYFDTYGGVQQVIQTWLMVADGGLFNSTKVTVEVSATIETPKVLANGYAAFATSTTCAALTFGGTFDSNSYDSSGLSGSTTPTIDNSDGDVGTNGNMTISGNAMVNGNLYTPRSGVGSCTAGNVTALTGSTAQVNGSIVQLPKAVTFTPPVQPAPSTRDPVDFNSSGGSVCSDLGFPFSGAASVATCTLNGNDVILDGHGATVSLPEVRINGHANVILIAGIPPAQYNFNSIFIASQSDISVKATSPDQKAVVDIIGQDKAGATIATPMDFQGGSFAGVNSCSGCTGLCPSCSAFDATQLTFIYSGDQTLEMRGNPAAAATVYAPLANVDLGGTADMYGSIVGKTVSSSGNVGIHYDRKLEGSVYVAGQPMVGTFTWKRF
jgi:hypothetical protein